MTVGQDIYTLVGIIAVLMISLGVLAFGVAAAIRQLHESYYNGLRSQIADTVAAISEHYEPGERMSEAACRRILVLLNARRWPQIGDIKANDLAGT